MFPGSSPALPIADPWWAAEPLDHGITRLYEPPVHPLLQGNAFFIVGRNSDLIVDTGTGIASIRDALEHAGLLTPAKPLTAVATHSHYDHVGCLYEFEERLIHPAEADELVAPSETPTLLTSRSDPEFIAIVEAAGMDLPELLIDAVPAADFDPAAYSFPFAAATGTLVDGDTIDLGDRSFLVLHLPGHSPGSIGLYEERTGVLVAGDLIYDDVLIAEGPGTDLADYIASMERILELDVSVVHGGHEPSFGEDRMREIAADFFRAHTTGDA